MFSIQRSDIPWTGYRDYPPQLNITLEVLDRPVNEGLGNRAALRYEGGTLSYHDLHSRVAGLAWSLKRLGLKRGELVLIQMPNSPEFAMAFLAIIKLGAIPVLVNSLLGSAELAAILEHARPRIVVTEATRAQSVRELRVNSSIEQVICVGEIGESEVTFDSLLGSDQKVEESAETAADAPAFIVYTSGTTGKPKGIVHAHRWIAALGDLNRLRLPPKEGDVVMATGEWSFISALGHNLLFPLRNGVTGAILSGRPTPENILSSIQRYQVTVLYSVATVYRRLLAIPEPKRRWNLSSLRCANSTGEALREDTYHAWKRRVGCEIYEHYGVSEFQLIIGQGPEEPVQPGSVGKSLPGVPIAILDDHYRPVAPGEIGRFAISAKDPGLFISYYKDLERTHASCQNGWYLTGDLAYQNNEGYHFITGRSDDCFKSRGLFISPAEIENALQKHPAVVEAVVVPDPDPEIGNKIRAVVILGNGFTPSESLGESIRSSLRSHIAPFKVPHRIEFADNLPRSPVGKILRGELTRLREG